MKRILLVFAMLLISITMLAAHDSSIGISIAPESYWLTKASGQALPDNTGMTRFYLMFDGSNYFGDNHGFGIDYGIGALFSLNMWSGNVTQSIENAPVGLAFYLGPGYRYEFSDNFFYYIELKLVNTIRKSLDLYKIYIKSMFTFPPWIASYSLSFPQVFHNVIHLLSTG